MRQLGPVASALVACALVACAERYEPPVTEGRDVRLTLLHTTDIHSRLLPYDMRITATDRGLGLDQDNEPFGGIARMAHVIQRERARAPRSIYVDSGDCFQGAPIFNAFLGEVEQRALSQMRPDAVVIGNHEFDEGIRNYVKQLDRWATYPVVAANYLFEPDEPLGHIAQPVEIVNADGLIIGIIGVANFSSISSITDIGNSLHIVPMDIQMVVQEWIDILEPSVDLIVAVSHGGLTEDEELIKHTRGLDIIMGGHLHVVLMPPKVILDSVGRPVVLAHSGAFAKYVGKLDVVVRDGEVVAHDYEVFPIDSTVPEDPEMVNLVEPYRRELHQLIDLNSVFGYSSRVIGRFGFDGGDSALGNLVSEAIRQYARADFGMTNSLGIRTDITPGAIGLDQLFNIFPFNNYVTTMYLSGADVQELLDFSSRRSAGRGCATQIQVSGIEYVMDCSVFPAVARDIVLTNCGDPSLIDKSDCTRVPLDPEQVYEMATNDYIAGGGSGFTVLKTNNTQVVTDVALRDAVLETVIRSPLCVEQCRADDGRLVLERCIAYETCVADLMEFYGRRCRRVTETTPGEVTLPQSCPVQLGGACRSNDDCAESVACDAEFCTACATNAQCGEGERCLSGWCRPTDLVCDGGRCTQSCETTDDCAGSHVLPEGAGQLMCVGSRCLPRQGAACVDDSGCVDVDAQCPEGACVACDGPPDCAAGELCVGGSCVVPTAVCRDFRCRVMCRDEADCRQGEICDTVGQCIPRDCSRAIDPGLACDFYAESRALERCLDVPCPRAESDGRIGRILPANLGDLPEDDNPDDRPAGRVGDQGGP